MGNDRGPVRLGIVGAGVIACVHTIASRLAEDHYPALPHVAERVAVGDTNGDLASDVARRFGFARAATDWRTIVEAYDVDLVCSCLPPHAQPRGRGGGGGKARVL
jgi:predicted dehydrogenase